MARQGTSVKRAAELLGVTPKWIRARIADSSVSPKRTGSGRNARYTLTEAEIETLRGLASRSVSDVRGDALARIDTLEAQRANLLARLSWERATTRAREEALHAERARVDQLMAELAAQRTRVEQLKALSLVDRLLGKHKDI
jgi:hypothetical protein